MIHSRRSSPFLAHLVAEAPGVVTPAPGAFAVQVEGTAIADGGSISLGVVLRGFAAEFSVVVSNAGASLLAWDALSISGAGATFLSITDGAAVPLAVGDSQTLACRADIPANQTVGTYAITFLVAAGATTHTVTVNLTVEAEPVEPPVVLSPVTALAAVAGDESVFLTWTGASGAETYQVWQSTVNGGPYTQVQTVDASQNFASIGSLTNGTPYYFVIYSVAPGFTTSAASAQATATPESIVIDPGTSPPQKVSGLVAEAGFERVELTWEEAEGATSYVVVVVPTAPTAEIEFKLRTSATGQQGTISHIHVNELTNDQEYTFTVYAVNATGMSDGVSVTATPHEEGGGNGDPLDRSLTATLFSITALDPAPTQSRTANIIPCPGVYVSHFYGSQTFGQIGAVANAAMLAQPEGFRAIHFGHVGHGRSDMPNLHTGLTPYSLVADGINTARWAEGFLELWEACPTRPDWGILDEETVDPHGAYLLPFWGTLGVTASERASKFREIYENPTLLRRLPYALRSSSVAELETIDSPLAPQATLASVWDAYCWAKRADALRAITVDTWQATYGGAPPTFVNYDDLRLVRMFRDLYNWPTVPSTRSMSVYSSPEAYIGAPATQGQFPKWLGEGSDASKNERWHAFVDHINILRSLRTFVMPWWSRLRYRNDGDGITPDFTADPEPVRELYRHSCEMGNRYGILFCPGITAGELAEWQQLVETTEVKTPPKRRLPNVQYTDDHVTTGSHTTRYADFDWS